MFQTTPHPLAALSLLVALAAPNRAQEQVRFTDHTAASGVQVVHTDRLDTMAGGVCLFDHDNDGDVDLFVTARGGGTNSLWENDGLGHFVDVTQAAGVGDRLETMGAYAADLDNDGFQDLVVLARFRIKLYQNQGDGTFVDVASRSRLGRTTWPTAAAICDYDRDGDLDIFVGNYIGEGFFPYFDGYPNQLFRNDGNFTFAETAGAAGVEGIETFMDPRGFTRTTAGCTLSVLFHDYDEDGWPDLFVGNDFGTTVIPNQLFHNDGNGQFTDVSSQMGFRKAEFNMGLALADVTGDGVLDIYTSSFGSNSLMVRDQVTGRYADLAPCWNLMETMSMGGFLVSWAAMFLDANFDAGPDVYVSNGFLQSEPNLPSDPNSPSHLLIKQGQTYTIAPAADVPQDLGVGRGAACADLDGDGDEDIVQLNNRQALGIYVNDTIHTNRVARLDLVGTTSNRDGIGARLRIESNQHVTPYEHVRGGSYISCNGATIIRGLGTDPRIERLAITWPSGIESERFGLAADVRHRIVEPRVTITQTGTPMPIGDLYVQVDVDVQNHTDAAEDVQFQLRLEIGGQRYDLPTFHGSATVPAQGTLRVPVYVAFAPSLLPLARQLGAGLGVAARDPDQGTDEWEGPLR
jgi:hypothetical protein